MRCVSPLLYLPTSTGFAYTCTCSHSRRIPAAAAAATNRLARRSGYMMSVTTASYPRSRVASTLLPPLASTSLMAPTAVRSALGPPGLYRSWCRGFPLARSSVSACLEVYTQSPVFRHYVPVCVGSHVAQVLSGSA